MSTDELIMMARNQRMDNDDNKAELHMVAIGYGTFMVWWNTEDTVFIGDSLHTVLMHIVHCDTAHRTTQCDVLTGTVPHVDTVPGNLSIKE